MSTQQKTQTTNQYDPTSMGAFQGLTGSMLPLLQQFMNNPFASQQFGIEQQMGTRQAQNIGGTQMGNITRNLTASGMPLNSPAAMEMLNNQMRANSGLQSQLGFLSPVQNALQRQMWSMGTAAGYRPLQTGGTQVQTQSGLGTWLPQLLSGGMGLASTFMGGGGSGFDYSGAGMGPSGGFAGVSGTPGQAPDIGVGLPAGISNPFLPQP